MAPPREVLCRSALTKTGIPGYDYCLNPYIGCMHNCVYCYAAFMKRFTGHQEPWGCFVDIKVNMPEVLSKQLGRKNPPRGRVIVGSVTDSYQPVEAQYGITRRCLSAITACPFLEVSILTKSALIVRDIDILRNLPGLKVGFSFTTLNDKASRVLEPGASAPGLRLAAARQLIQKGIPVWIFIAPLLPGISDEMPKLKQMLMEFSKLGVDEILVDMFNPYAALLHRVKEVYHRCFPTAKPHLEAYLHNRSLYREQVLNTLGGWQTEAGIVVQLL